MSKTLASAFLFGLVLLACTQAHGRCTATKTLASQPDLAHKVASILGGYGTPIADGRTKYWEASTAPS